MAVPGWGEIKDAGGPQAPPCESHHRIPLPTLIFLSIGQLELSSSGQGSTCPCLPRQ